MTSPATNASPEHSSRTANASKTAEKASSMMPRPVNAFLVLTNPAKNALLKLMFAKNVKLVLSERVMFAFLLANSKMDYSWKMSKDPSLLKTVINALLNAKLART